MYWWFVFTRNDFQIPLSISFSTNSLNGIYKNISIETVTYQNSRHEESVFLNFPQNKRSSKSFQNYKSIAWFYTLIFLNSVTILAQLGLNSTRICLFRQSPSNGVT